MRVQVSKLANGLTVVSEEMPHLESAALGVWVKAGARHERREQHGVAHLLEHMAFKGTARRSAARIAEEIENVGGEVNAATSVETTAYYARVMKEDVPLAVDILHDILAHSTFDTGELKREQHVILQEIGAANDTPDDMVFDLFQDTAFAGQPIGRPILGTPETVSGFGPDDLRDYLSAHYRGPNMVLSAAGAINHEALVAQASELFADFADDAPPPPQRAFYSGGETAVQREFQEAQLLLGFEGRAYHARDFYASQLLATVLGGGMSSRLFQEVREKRGLCYSIYAFHWGFADTGTFGIHAATGEEDLKELMPVIIDELKRASETISDAEVDRARAQIRSSLMMSMESPAARAGQIARQILLFGRPIPNEELTERLAAISTKRLCDLAGRTFHQCNPTLAAVGPLSGIMRQEAIAERLGYRAATAAE
ncbi:MAG: insulinase family protein [Nitratireductor sp.]|nr:insulinase family protein [Nitratireductor sp.]